MHQRLFVKCKTPETARRSLCTKILESRGNGRVSEIFFYSLFFLLLFLLDCIRLNMDNPATRAVNRIPVLPLAWPSIAYL